MIEVPNGVTLDGQNRTIVLLDSSSNLGSGVRALGVFDVTVRNLTLHRPATDRCSDFDSNLIFSGSGGNIENVSISNDCERGAGILLIYGSVDMDGVTIRAAGRGIISEGASGLVTDCDIQGAEIGIDIVSPEEPAEFALTIEGNTFTGNDRGVVARIGRDSEVTVQNNTIVGPGPIDRDTAGVVYGNNTDGSVSGNTISNYFDARTGLADLGCGISLLNAGNVTIGANTFPDPPGNEQNVCDFRA